MREQLKIYFSIAALLLFSTWFVYSISPEEHPVSAVPDDIPDYYMESFLTTAFGVNGEIRQLLSAKRISHFPIDNHSKLENLVVSASDQNEKYLWSIQADEGFTNSITDELTLAGKVKISQPDNPKSISIITPSLVLDPKNRIAKTDDKVIIANVNGELTAQGMEILFQNHTIELHSHIRGYYNVTR